ncbi:MAG: aspartate kinase [Campylobacterota bacterium]
MSKQIVCKFGGSSVENATQIKKVVNIVKENSQRRFVVVSAPGKDEKYGVKITDHLLNISNSDHLGDEDISADQSKKCVIEKFETLLKDLKVEDKELISDLKKDLETKLTGEKREAFLASRGEKYNARVIADYMNKTGIKTKLVLPEEIGFMLSKEYLNAKILKETYKNFEKLKNETDICLMPGFYGITNDGDVAVLSRGGSDLTGGELAYSVNASMYENWSDIDGVYDSDPRIVEKADVVQRLTFKEIRMLSSKGFNVFHFDAMVNCKKRNIPINIRNTNKPSASGTMILTDRVPMEHIVGIAQLNDMAYVYVEKDGISDETGFTEKLLSIFNRYKIKTHYYPTDKDDIAVLISQDDLEGHINNLKQDIETELDPDVIDVVYNLSILSAVGIGIKDDTTIIADAILALKDNNIEIEMMDQSPAKISFQIAVNSQHADIALKVLHDKLI